MTIFNGCKFKGNEATITGATLYTGAELDEIVNITFVRNTAKIGGALRLVGTASIGGCKFEDNLPDEDEGPGVVSEVLNCTSHGKVFNYDPGTYLDYNTVSFGTLFWYQHRFLHLQIRAQKHSTLE